MKQPGANVSEKCEFHANTVEHAKAGYHNAQDIIKFIDAKTGAVTGIGTLAIGGVWGIIGFYFDLNAEVRNIVTNYAPLYIPGIFIGVSLLAGVIALAFSMLSLIARGPTSESTVLFPFVPPDNELNFEYYDQLSHGMTQNQILTEYRIQIHTVGTILRKKMKWHRRAVLLLLIQLGAFAFTPFTSVGYSLARKYFALETEAPILVTPSLSACDTLLHPPANAPNNSTGSANGE